MIAFIDDHRESYGVEPICKVLVERTPLGFLSSEIRADLAGKNGNTAQETAMARMIARSAMAMLFDGLAARGLISGSGPMDRNKMAVWRAAGNQPRSIRIGDMWYGVRRLGALGMMMRVAADFYNIGHIAETGDVQKVALELTHAISQNILDESFMRGPADLIKAMTDPGRYGSWYIRQQIASVVPFSVRLAQIDRASDPYSRQTRSIMDATRQKIPGLSETLPPRIDIWGEPIPNTATLGPPGLTAICETKANADPVNIALWNLGMGVAFPSRRIRNMMLDDQQYEYYSRIAGRTAKQRLDVIVSSPDFQTWAPEIQAHLITEVLNRAREAARGMVMMRWPEIAREATAAKLAAVHGTLH